MTGLDETARAVSISPVAGSMMSSVYVGLNSRLESVDLVNTERHGGLPVPRY